MLYGRDTELGVLSSLVSRSTTGAGGALVLRGEAGIGKTALLTATREAATGQGLRALTATGVQSEASIPYACLHQLLRPVLGHVVSLTDPQRQALLASFGVTGGIAPEMFSVGLACLELLSGLADSAPMVLVIDDAQWIDRPSSEALAFIARRLDAERIVMLFAVRDGYDTVLNEAGLPELQVTALNGDAASALLRERAPGLDATVRARVLTEAAGNPLALVELPAAVADTASYPSGVIPRLAGTRRVEQAFLSRVSALPAPTQTLLLVAAADEEGDLAEILEASAALHGEDVTVDDISPALNAGLLELTGHELRFRHPLVRSTVYHAAPPSRRLAAHSALATVLAGHAERRAWHRAAASPGPDDTVALDLETAAGKAVQRGAPRAAAEALRQAASLSRPDTHRGRLLLRAAEINFDLGETALARRQLADAAPTQLEEGERLRLTLWTEALNEESWFTPEHVDAFAGVAARLADSQIGGATLALRALWPLSITCWYGHPPQETRALTVKTAQRLRRNDKDPLELSIAACADPVGQAARVIREVAAMEPGYVSDPVEQHALGASLTSIWAFDLAWPYLCAAVDGLRRQGRLGLLGEALTSQAWAAILLGKHRLATSAADEAMRLSRDTGRPRWALVADLAMATLINERGGGESADTLIQAAEAELLSAGAQSILGYAQFARGRRAVVSNQHNDAFEQLARTLDPADITYHPFIGYWAIADLIEAADRTDRHEEQAALLSRLDALAGQTRAPFLQAMAAYSHALVAPDQDSEALYQEALDGRLATWPLHRAKLLLAYGRWLRRRRRLIDARRPLRAAIESFDALGIKAHADDARTELRATGEAVPLPKRDSTDKLTPQELQIARLAASGLTNREIGEQLFLSHRTVGHHLHRIFPKLGITSRGQLRLTDLGTG